MQELRDRVPASLRGWTLRELLFAARRIGLEARPLRIDLKDLRRLRQPLILHWDQNHFVVLGKAGRRHAIVFDPALGRRRLSLAEVSRRFTGVVIECWPATDFERPEAAARLRYRDLLQQLSGRWSSFCYLFLLSMALTVLVLAAPFYTQLVIDRALVSGDVDLLLLLAVTFSLLAIVSSVTEALRAWVISLIGAKLSLAWSSASYRRLLELPYAFFEHRTTGDIQSRFRSIDGLRNLFSSQAVESIVDCITVFAALAIMALYSPTLSAVVIVGFLAVTVIRFSFAPSTRLAAREAIAADAERDSVFLNTLRGIIPIKNFAQEGHRIGVFGMRIEQTVEATIRVARLSILARCLSSVVSGLQMVLLVWVGANAVLAGNMSIGMLVAFLAYSRQFDSRSSGLVDRLLMFYTGRAHLERLADIVLQRPEVPATQVLMQMDREIRLTAEGLAYRYSGAEAHVLQNVSLDIPAGCHLVITGPSGCGKSTLLKLLCGLLAPESGALMLNGTRVGKHNLQSYRSKIAVVMQNDVLFPGSLSDNLTLGDAFDEQKIWSVLESVQAAGLVRGLPMGLHTRVGELGESFSGGERQRIVLARALYRSRPVLFLDEATSQLDVRARLEIHRTLAQLPITRVSVSHCDDLIRQADIEFRMDDISVAKLGH